MLTVDEKLKIYLNALITDAKGKVFLTPAETERFIERAILDIKRIFSGPSAGGQ